MAHHKSAVKRARQSRRRSARNQAHRTRVKSAVKAVRGALGEGDAGRAAEALRSAESVLRRAASKGAIPAKRASRRVSRLARQLQRLQS